MVLLCVVCQEKAQKAQQLRAKELALECGVGLERSKTSISNGKNGDDNEDSGIDEKDIRRAALALAKDLRLNKIPSERYTELKQKILKIGEADFDAWLLRASRSIQHGPAIQELHPVPVDVPVAPPGSRSVCLYRRSDFLYRFKCP